MFVIFDSIKHYRNYVGYPELFKVLSYLANMDTSDLDGGRVLVPGRVFGHKVSFTSRPDHECRFEAHKKYIDVHYILRGCERIEMNDVERLDEIVPYDEEKDIGFYEGAASVEYVLKPGEFVVCYPNEAHKVGMSGSGLKQPEDIEKIVFKIMVNDVSAATFFNHSDADDIVESVKGKLIVSCQALPHEPLHSSYLMGRMAQAVQEGGAGAIRANSAEDILEIKGRTGLPIIGIIKRDYKDCDVYITPTMKEIDELMGAHPDIIALDATQSIRPDGKSLDDFYVDIRRDYPNQLLMADCSTVEEAVHADELGFDFIGTTLVGYTEQSRGLRIEEDDFSIIRQIIAAVRHPVIAEGNIDTPHKAKRVLELGCHSVVVGSIITRPQLITKRFAEEIYGK